MRKFENEDGVQDKIEYFGALKRFSIALQCLSRARLLLYLTPRQYDNILNKACINIQPVTG